MRKQLLIIGFVWPEPKSSAAGSRMLQLINAFLSHNYKITFASPCSKNDNAFDLESINVSKVSIELNTSSFDDFIKDFQPNIVLFDRFMMEEQFGWRVAEQCPEALRILDTEDLHCLRKGRQQAFNDKKSFDTSYLFNDIAKREIASIYRSDLSLIISEAEINILHSEFKIEGSLLYYLPFMINKVNGKKIECLPKFKDRYNFISIGNFLHNPNYNSVLYLKETIWPLIRQKLPKAKLNIYGAYVSEKVMQLHNPTQGFYIKGFANDVNEIMQYAKVCLAPLCFGAGLKGKLIDAMQNGTPCVTTTIGAEGMFGDLEHNGYVENDPKIFACRAIELYSNESLWETKQQNGFKVINTRFDKTNFEKDFIKTIETLRFNLQQHRLQNFTGEMLQHHTLQSTKFMSKWIEEKNRN